ncbi:unnamed protein product [Prorocentrum cordatum]|uniref:Methyltransferase domain-containing protein n=1 Tax=Prorocentrum cordatum TaxID=2364126 RepID=A0ABN9RAV2_9DINO|nr:unnamed protein product [Polarella glacialis]
MLGRRGARLCLGITSRRSRGRPPQLGAGVGEIRGKAQGPRCKAAGVLPLRDPLALRGRRAEGPAALRGRVRGRRGGPCAVAVLVARRERAVRLGGHRPDAIEAALELLRAGTPLGDAAAPSGGGALFVDLGCGDGCVVCAVVQRFGCRGVGVDVLPGAVAQARAAAGGLPPARGGGARFLCADMADVRLAEADIVFLYLPPDMARDVVLGLLPASGLRAGTHVLINDAADGLRHGCGLRHLRRARSRGGGQPVDLFEWLGQGATAGRPLVSRFFAEPLGGARQQVSPWDSAQ